MLFTQFYGNSERNVFAEYDTSREIIVHRNYTIKHIINSTGNRPILVIVVAMVHDLGYWDTPYCYCIIQHRRISQEPHFVFWT